MNAHKSALEFLFHILNRVALEIVL